MSNVSTIFDAILSTMDTLFTAAAAKTRLPNPYILEENPVGLLRNGYGLITGPSESPDFEFKSTLQSRAFDIPLTRQLIKLDSSTSIIEELQKTMLEDIKLIQVRFENPDQIGIESSIENISIGPTTGIEYLRGDDERFLTITQTLIIQWSELIGA